jgi:hypothetical protein
VEVCVALESWEEVRKFIEALTTGPLISLYVAVIFRGGILDLMGKVKSGSLTVGPNKLQFTTIREVVDKEIKNVKLRSEVIKNLLETGNGESVDEGDDEDAEDTDQEDDHDEDDQDENDDASEKALP